jgi:hypothetical protein
MKGFQGPALTQQVGTHYILWFKNSNQYIVTAKSLYFLIEAFLASKNTEDYNDTANDLGYDRHSAEQFFKEIDQFLENCNTKHEVEAVVDTSFSNVHRQLTHYYQINKKIIVVHYGSEVIRSLIHPQLEHLELPGDDKHLLCVFDIYSHENRLVLFKDEMLLGSWPSKDYHLLQGKFAMHILCALHGNEELDWMGTFHASTVTVNDEAIMVIGDSGKGKSTFTALLLANGYQILADDITPILTADSLVYPYPGAISIKSGAFDTLKSVIPNFDKLPEHYVNRHKGKVKYLAATKSMDYLSGYSCKNIVSINYKTNSETKLETISIAQALNTLIPESWLAPKKNNAKQFLYWIKDVQFYELTYSNSKEAIKVFSDLIEGLK